MSQFPEFESTFGPPQDCVAVPEETFAKYREVLPEQLLAYWRETGWCSYQNGLLWTVDPAQFSDVIDEWVEGQGSTPCVFLRTAFAHLYFWLNGAVYSLDVQTGDVSEVTRRFFRIFELLCDSEIQAKILRVSLFKQVHARLGPPSRDECYAFEPALALGGPGTADTVRKVRMREHLGILAESLREERG